MRRTVLLVEDEAKLADVLAEQLAQEDFDVRKAGSLRQSLRMLDDLVPDVAVVDIGLPDGSGLDVLRRLRCGADRLDSGTPVLVLTARTEEADVLRGVRARCRRLPAEALRPPGADRSGSCAAGSRAAGCTPTSDWAICCSSPPRAARVGPEASCRCRGANTTCCSSSHATPAPCARRRISCARYGACRRRCGRGQSTRMRAACGASSSRRARRAIRSSTSGGGVTASKSLVPARQLPRHVPLEARLSIAVALVVALALAAIGLARRRARPRSRGARGPGEPRAHAGRGVAGSSAGTRPAACRVRGWPGSTAGRRVETRH